MSQDLLAWSGAAYDSQALNGLKRDVAADPQGNLKQVAQQLEGMFVQMMLKSMRSALPQEGILNSEQTRLYTSLYDQQLAQQMAQKGIGLADVMVRQLSNGEHRSEERAATAPWVSDKQALPAFSSSMLQTLSSQPLQPLSLQPFSLQQFSLQQQVRRAVPQLPKGGTMPLTTSSFVARLASSARLASQQSGIPHQLIMAQAALESGWGQREIPTREGSPSYNLFGIKAGSNWQGPVTEIITTEFEQGVAKKIKARFRVYGSYLEGIGDYVKLLTSNPRYANVAAAPNAEQAAHALQQAGYATDPLYAKKLVGVIQQIKNASERAVKAYQFDINELF